MNVMWSIKSESKQRQDWPLDVVSVMIKFLKPLERIPFLTVNKSMIIMFNSPLFASLRMARTWTEFIQETPHQCDFYLETMDHVNLKFLFYVYSVEIRSSVRLQTLLSPSLSLRFQQDSNDLPLRFSYDSKHVWSIIWHLLHGRVKEIRFSEGQLHSYERPTKVKRFLETVLVGAGEHGDFNDAELHPLFSMFLIILSKCDPYVQDTKIVLMTSNPRSTPQQNSLAIWLKKLNLEHMSRKQARRFSKEELFATV